MGKQQNKALPVANQPLSEVMLEQIISVVMKQMRKGRQILSKECCDHRLRDTKLLLRNYRRLVVHSENAISDAVMLENEALLDVFTLMSNGFIESYNVESIKNSAAKTKIILEHVDNMLRLYQHDCEASTKPEDVRRYRVIKAMYLDGIDSETVAERECIDKSTVYRDIDEACRRLSIYFFGADSIQWT